MLKNNRLLGYVLDINMLTGLHWWWKRGYYKMA